MVVRPAHEMHFSCLILEALLATSFAGAMSALWAFLASLSLHTHRHTVSTSSNAYDT